MSTKNLLTKIKSNFLLNEIISYLQKLKILELFKYSKTLQNLLNISLYNYQKECFSLSFFTETNPLNYNIDHLYNVFKELNLFNRENDKENFIKIIKELFPEDKNKDSDDDNLLPKDKKEFYEIKNISQLDDLKNLTSLQLFSPDNWDLNKLGPGIKELKITYGSARIPLSVLNNLETLIIEKNTVFDIYDINCDEKIYELKNLKYLSLAEEVEVQKNLNIKFSVPNIEDLTIVVFDCLYIKEQLIFYFNILDFGDGEKNSNILGDLIDKSPEEDMNNFYSTYNHLKNLYLYFFDNSEPNVIHSKELKIKETQKNILKINYIENEGINRGSMRESFFVKFTSNDNIENGEIFGKKSKFIVTDDYNPIGYEYELYKYEEIKIEMYERAEIFLFQKIKEENFSLQVIEIKDYENEQYSADRDCFIYKEDIQNLCENIEKFNYLRKIGIFFTYHNYKGIFESKELETLINNLSKLDFIEEIYIDINNSDLSLSKEAVELFPGMVAEIKDDIFNAIWKYK